MNHYIIVKYLPHITRKEEMYHEIVSLFKEALQLEGIKKVEVYQASVVSDIRYDLMIHMVMEKEALPIFDHSWIHHEWKKNYAQYISHKVIFDCA
ncbi:MAG: hypothetical protein GX786_08750 [Clostridiales bacterium]|nr:hypothetical protein [Clostridiales bacterium]